MKIIGKKCTN